MNWKLHSETCVLLLRAITPASVSFGDGCGFNFKHWLWHAESAKGTYQHPARSHCKPESLRLMHGGFLSLRPVFRLLKKVGSLQDLLYQ